MELNAEQIKKALECCAKGCCGDCPHFPSSLGCCRKTILDALALINSQEQKIFELENRFKECENGYKGTNFLDRCKLHDAEEKFRKLTEENERVTQHLHKELENNRKICEMLDKKVVECESLHASCTELARKMQDNVRAENEELQKSRECDVRKLKADTVRKMQERLKKRRVCSSEEVSRLSRIVC